MKKTHLHYNRINLSKYFHSSPICLWERQNSI